MRDNTKILIEALGYSINNDFIQFVKVSRIDDEEVDKKLLIIPKSLIKDVVITKM